MLMIKAKRDAALTAAKEAGLIPEQAMQYTHLIKAFLFGLLICHLTFTEEVCAQNFASSSASSRSSSSHMTTKGLLCLQSIENELKAFILKKRGTFTDPSSIPLRKRLFYIVPGFDLFALTGIPDRLTFSGDRKTTLFESYRIIESSYKLLAGELTGTNDPLVLDFMKFYTVAVADKNLEEEFKNPRVIASFVIESVEVGKSCNSPVWGSKKILNYVRQRLNHVRKNLQELSKKLDLQFMEVYEKPNP